VLAYLFAALLAAMQADTPQLDVAREARLERYLAASAEHRQRIIKDLTKRINQQQAELRRLPSNQQGAIRRSIDSTRQRLDAVKKNDPPYLAPLPAGEPLAVGMIGTLDRPLADGTKRPRVKVLQVVAAEDVVAQWHWTNQRTGNAEPQTIWVRGVPTAGFSDGQAFDFPGVFDIATTKTYETPLGTTSTVVMLERVELPAAAPKAAARPVADRQTRINRYLADCSRERQKLTSTTAKELGRAKADLKQAEKREPFSGSKSDVRTILDAKGYRIRTLRNEIAVLESRLATLKKNDPPFRLKMPAGKPLEVGMIGELPTAVLKVLQVIDDQNCLAECDSPKQIVWIKGVPTAGLAGGLAKTFDGAFDIDASKEHEMPDGATRAVVVLERVELPGPATRPKPKPVPKPQLPKAD
jgi:hypothetical protein